MRRSIVFCLTQAVWLSVLLFGNGSRAAPPGSVADFYAGKTIKLIVSAGAGGGYDLYGRTLATRLGDHIPGNPKIIVQNMTGAGGLTAADYIYRNAPRDGSVIALIQSTALMAPYFDNPAAKFDPEKFTWIGNISKEYSLCVSWRSSPVKTAQDLFTKQFVVGSSGAGTSMETYPNILNYVFGTHIKVIAGYTGGASVLLAMERGEVQGRCGASLETYEAIRPLWLKNHMINLLLQTSLHKDPKLPDTPWIMDYAKTDRQRAILKLVLGPRLIQRPLVASPGVPQDRVKALRDAFDATVRDPDFLAKAKAEKLEIAPMAASDMIDFVKDLAKTPREIRRDAEKALIGHE